MGQGRTHDARFIKNTHLQDFSSQGYGKGVARSGIGQQRVQRDGVEGDGGEVDRSLGGCHQPRGRYYINNVDVNVDTLTSIYCYTMHSEAQHYRKWL